MDPRFYRTFKVFAPLRTHWKKVSCEEYDCPEYRFGWVTTIDTSTELGQKRYHFITHDKERRYSHQQVTPTLHVFTYGPGQRPFYDEARHTHFAPIGRDPYYLVHDGDWRGNPTGNRVVHRSHEDWVDQFANNQSVLLDMQNRG